MWGIPTPYTFPLGKCFWKKYWENVSAGKNYWKKYWQKVNIDKNYWKIYWETEIKLKRFLIDPLTTINAIYDDSLTLTEWVNTKVRFWQLKSS